MFATGKYVVNFSLTSPPQIIVLWPLCIVWEAFGHPQNAAIIVLRANESIQASTQTVILKIIIPIIKFRILNNHYSYMSLLGRITPTSLK